MSKAVRGWVSGMMRWRGRDAWTFLTATIVLAVATHSARAAEISLSERPGCLFELNGPIISGDAARFAALADEHWHGIPALVPQFTENIALCLDSPGGVFLEGQHIARAVNERAIVSQVASGAECVSACALVFMAGRIKTPENDDVHRTLHVTARLGLHAPYLELKDDQNFSGAKVTGFLSQHNGMIADLMRFSARRGRFQFAPAISLNLLAEMMTTPPEEMFMIDTVEKAARWAIRLEGTRDEPRLDRLDQLQLCENKFAWIYDRRSERVTDEDFSWVSIQTSEMQTAIGPTEVVEMDLNYGPLDTTCTIQLPGQAWGHFGICLDDGMTGLGLGGDCDDPDSGVWVPWWHAMPPDMPLAALQ